MNWVKDYDGDYVNLENCEYIYIYKNFDIEQNEVYEVRTRSINDEVQILLKCKEERTARHFLGRLMKKLKSL